MNNRERKKEKRMSENYYATLSPFHCSSSGQMNGRQFGKVLTIWLALHNESFISW